MVMEKAKHDFTWHQGEDLVIDITYQLNGTPVDLTGHTVRMDIAAPGSTAPIFSFNSADFNDPALDTTGTADNEATVNASGNIHIVVPRSLTLPGGAVGQLISGQNPVKTFNYDLFVRTPQNTQKKLLMGNITVEKSVTRWT